MTSAQRSYNMSRIRAKDTKPEIVVRKYLWSHGYRYRLNHPRLPGKPDVVLRKFRTCIFVNGCFWHGHHVVCGEVQGVQGVSEVQSSGCCKIPKTNREFWVKKITRNKERDFKVQQELARMGWHCITIWECQLKPNIKLATLEGLVNTLSKIFLADHRIKKYESEEPELCMVAENTIEYGN